MGTLASGVSGHGKTGIRLSSDAPLRILNDHGYKQRNKTSTFLHKTHTHYGGKKNLIYFHSFIDSWGLSDFGLFVSPYVPDKPRDWRALQVHLRTLILFRCSAEQLTIEPCFHTKIQATAVLGGYVCQFRTKKNSQHHVSWTVCYVLTGDGEDIRYTAGEENKAVFVAATVLLTSCINRPSSGKHAILPASLFPNQSDTVYVSCQIPVTCQHHCYSDSITWH